jgi:hypothetical protein
MPLRLRFMIGRGSMTLQGRCPSLVMGLGTGGGQLARGQVARGLLSRRSIGSGRRAWVERSGIRGRSFATSAKG